MECNRSDDTAPPRLTHLSCADPTNIDEIGDRNYDCLGWVHLSKILGWMNLWELEIMTVWVNLWDRQAKARLRRWSKTMEPVPGRNSNIKTAFDCAFEIRKYSPHFKVLKGVQDIQ